MVAIPGRILITKIAHRAGKASANADALTRMKCKQCGLDVDPDSHMNRMMKENSDTGSADVNQKFHNEQWTPENIAKLTEKMTEN